MELGKQHQQGPQNSYPISARGLEGFNRTYASVQSVRLAVIASTPCWVRVLRRRGRRQHTGARDSSRHTHARGRGCGGRNSTLEQVGPRQRGHCAGGRNLGRRGRRAVSASTVVPSTRSLRWQVAGFNELGNFIRRKHTLRGQCRTFLCQSSIRSRGF